MVGFGVLHEREVLAESAILLTKQANHVGLFPCCGVHSLSAL